MVIRKQFRKVYESEVETTAADTALRRYGVFSIKIAKAQEGGYPDRIFLIQGGFPFFIEFKRPGEEPTKQQEVIHARLRHAGYDVDWFDDADEALVAIEARVMEARRRTTEGRNLAVRAIGSSPVHGSGFGKDKHQLCSLLRPKKPKAVQGRARSGTAKTRRKRVAARAAEVD